MIRVEAFLHGVLLAVAFVSHVCFLFLYSECLFFPHQFVLLETRPLPTQRPWHKLSSAVRSELHKLLCLVNVIFKLGTCVYVFLKEFVYFLFTCRVVCPDASSLLVKRLKHFVETAEELCIFISGAMA